jgi:hypothetical protein
MENFFSFNNYRNILKLPKDEWNEFVYDANKDSDH